MRQFLFVFFLFGLLGCHQEDKTHLRPAPTTGTIINYGEEEGGKGDARRAWEEMVHRAAPGVDWRAVEYQNSMNLHRELVAMRRQGSGRSGFVALANGQVEGVWRERGASNQAGSVHDLAYDPEADAIYTIADGGSLWRVDIEEQNWTLINQDLRFDPGLLECVQDTAGNRRLIALIAKAPHFSDDNGQSWTPSELDGFTFDPSWANTVKSLIANDGKIYLLAQENYWANLRLYVSDDQGLSFRMIFDPPQGHIMNDILRPNHSEELILLRSSDTILYTELVSPEDEVITLHASSEQEVEDYAKLLGTMLPDSSLKLMAYRYEEIHQSLDTGRTWSFVGELPDSPWRVGLHMSKTDPNYLILGNVNLYYSEDGGGNWDQGAYWADYYDNVLFKLHADMMHFEEFQRPDGSYSTFVSSHGGLSISTDDPTEYLNLSLGGLNNAQYYSTATKRGTEDRIYAGSQDQGLQFQTGNNGEVENFDQVISGDYGNLSYSHVGERLYSMYPFGGLLTWNTQFNQYVDWTNVPGSDGFVWITPFMVVPDENAPKGEVLYLAGGQADGGSGSHLIRATDQTFDEFSTDYLLEDVSQDFLDGDGGGVITAVGYSPLNHQRLYVGTEGGRLFHTTDGGENWTPTLNFLPEGFYLYGQAILASRLEEERVWFGGSGYSNPAVYQSDDGGVTFYDISAGLPPTVVMRLAANNDESLLFAATESGPYVYVVADENWYYLGGTDAPAGRYYSVEYLPNSNIARFASYNRGVWDFAVSLEPSGIVESAQLPDWDIYPNPTKGPLNINGTPTGTTRIRVAEQNGRVVLEDEHPDLTQLPANTYFLTPINNNKRPTGRTKSIIRQ